MIPAHIPCLLAKVVENGAANRATDGVALMPKTAGVLLTEASLEIERGAERASDRRDNMIGMG